MVITTLIEELNRALAKVGDVEVEVRNLAGDMDNSGYVEVVEVLNISRKATEKDWRIHIEV